MSATAHLSHLMPTRRCPGSARLSRLQVRIRRLKLDRRLAAGEDPGTDPDLTIRTWQLTDGGDRRRLALVLDRVAAEATGPPAPFSSKRPLARAAITACAPRMQAIAARLWGDDRLAPQGVAQVSLLLREASSPLYSLSTTEDALRYRLAQIANSLGSRDATASPSA